MSESYTVKAEAREKVGKGAARHLRRNGMVPAVIYGDKQEPLPIAVPYKETFLKLHAGGFLTTVITIDVGGKKIQVLPKDYQLDVVKDTLTTSTTCASPSARKSRSAFRSTSRTKTRPGHQGPGRRSQRRAPRHRSDLRRAGNSGGLLARPDRPRDRRRGQLRRRSSCRRAFVLTTDEEFVIATIVPPMAEETDEDAETPETEVTGQSGETETKSED